MNKSEILRYLGHHGQEVSPQLDQMIDHLAELCRSTARPRSIWAAFECRTGEGGISLEPGGLLLPGTGIARHLAGATQAVLLTATLGLEIDRLIKSLTHRSMTEAVILGAAATEYMEQVCDQAQEEIAARFMPRGLHVRRGRYSPGYGDLPLDLQPRLLGMLDAHRKLGVTCTPDHVMIPSKTVTAIIGLSPQPPEQKTHENCALCNLKETCSYGKQLDRQ